MATDTAPETIELTVSKGDLLFGPDVNGNTFHTVKVDGMIRGRELIWAVRADGEERVIPASAWKAFVALESVTD